MKENILAILKTLTEEDKIKWNSRSSRIVRENNSIKFVRSREGIYKGIISPGQNPVKEHPWLKDLKDYQIRFGNGKTGISKNVRSIVEVKEGNKKPAYYGIVPNSIVEINDNPVS